jgi:hypothetical protein
VAAGRFKAIPKIQIGSSKVQPVCLFVLKVLPAAYSMGA